jgi:hypothetical protein
MQPRQDLLAAGGIGAAFKLNSNSMTAAKALNVNRLHLFIDAYTVQCARYAGHAYGADLLDAAAYADIDGCVLHDALGNPCQRDPNSNGRCTDVPVPGTGYMCACKAGATWSNGRCVGLYTGASSSNLKCRTCTCLVWHACFMGLCTCKRPLHATCAVPWLLR